MSHWENTGKSDEWYTPKYIFDALDVRFDLDVAAPVDRTHCHVPADRFITEDSLKHEWNGFVWMNPPFGGRNGIVPWMDKIHSIGNGIALTPDRTSAPWWQDSARHADAVLFLSGKVKFIKPDGTTGGSPSVGTTLLSFGPRGMQGLKNAQKNNLGILMIKP